MCILLVEDDALTRCAIATACVAAGLSVVESADGDHAAALFDAAPEQFTALVTDHDLPGMDGLTLAERVRQRAPKLPIVIASGQAEALHASHDPKLEFHVLRKPYSADALFVLLNIAGVHAG